MEKTIEDRKAFSGSWPSSLNVQMKKRTRLTSADIGVSPDTVTLRPSAKLLGRGLYLSVSTIKMYRIYSAHPVLHTCIQNLPEQICQTFPSRCESGFYHKCAFTKWGIKEVSLKPIPSGMRDLPSCNLVSSFVGWVPHSIWPLLRKSTIISRIKQLSKKSATSLFIKAYVVCITTLALP